MNVRRLHAALLCTVIAVGAIGSLSAQAPRKTSQAGAAPQTTTPPVETPVEQEDNAVRRYRILRPVIRIAQDYTLRPDDEVREIRSVMGDVTVQGRVRSDVVGVLGTVRLASTGIVEGSMVVIGGSAIVEEGAAVRRDLVVIGGTLTAPPDFSPDGDHVVIGTPMLGEALEGLLPWMTHGLLWGRLIVPDIEWIWAVVGVFFLVYLGINTVFDRPVAASARVIADRPLSAFMTGLVVLVLAIPVLIIVAATVIGVAIIPFLLCGLVAAALVGKTAVARAIGRSVIRSSSDGRFAGLVAFVIGFAFLVFAYMVPVMGFVTWALTSVIGLGAAMATFRGHLRRERGVTVAAPEAAVAPAAASAAIPPAMPAPIPAAVVTEPQQSFEAIPPGSVPPPPVATVPLEPPPPPRFTDGLAQYPRATFLDRAAAFALDCILVAIANELLDLSRHDGGYFLLLLGYHIAFWAWKGTTLGGIICNLRVIRTHGAELRFVDALVRGLSGVFSIAALGIGCLWMLQDPERQTWHDKIAGTLVVKVPRHLVLP